VPLIGWHGKRRCRKAGGQAVVFVEYVALKKYIRAILNLAVNTLEATRCERISFFFFFSLFQIPAEMQLGLVCTRLMPHGCKEDGVKPIIRNYLVDIFFKLCDQGFTCTYAKRKK
jgi:hypothetical protein